MKKTCAWLLSGILLLGTAASFPFLSAAPPSDMEGRQTAAQAAEEERQFIKWMDFDVTENAMRRALDYDVASQSGETPINWIDLLACLAAKYGGDFGRYRAADMDRLAKQLKEGETMEALTEDLKYYGYYREAYRAVLGGMVGSFEVQTDQNGQPQSQRRYGLKAFSPIAAGYGYSHCDDFGNRRSYGFARRHLGNDLMGSVGAPVVAVESGVVEALGWNRYGGWRVGIRSRDESRYYYYAHLRKDHPYHKSLYIGKQVTAGDVIGYLGMSGYSLTENTNNIRTPHLHFGIQIIFDESQKEGNHEIWIDAYHIVNFLQKSRSLVKKNAETGDFDRASPMRDPALYE